MTINRAIADYGEAAHGGIRVYVALKDRELTVRVYAKSASLRFSGHALSGLLEEEDCHLEMSPSGAGCAYFDRTRRSNSGLYFHRQPCRDHVRVFPSATGVGWLCISGVFDDAPVEERDSEVSFVVFEGDTTALSWLSGMLFQCASEHRHIVIDAIEIAAAFRCSPAFRLEIFPVEDVGSPASG